MTSEYFLHPYLELYRGMIARRYGSVDNSRAGCITEITTDNNVTMHFNREIPRHFCK